MRFCLLFDDCYIAITYRQFSRQLICIFAYFQFNKTWGMKLWHCFFRFFFFFPASYEQKHFVMISNKHHSYNVLEYHKPLASGYFQFFAFEWNAESFAIFFPSFLPLLLYGLTKVICNFFYCCFKCVWPKSDLWIWHSVCLQTMPCRDK